MASRADQVNQLSTRIGSVGGGTLSTSLDLEGWNVLGLIVIPAGTAVVAGSLSMFVSVDNTNFYALHDGNNANISIPHGTTGVAFSAVALQVLSPYRYVKFLDSSAQPTGMVLTVPVKLN